MPEIWLDIKSAIDPEFWVDDFDEEERKETVHKATTSCNTAGDENSGIFANSAQMTRSKSVQDISTRGSQASTDTVTDRLLEDIREEIRTAIQIPSWSYMDEISESIVENICAAIRVIVVNQSLETHTNYVCRSKSGGKFFGEARGLLLTWLSSLQYSNRAFSCSEFMNFVSFARLFYASQCPTS
jgi:hypothetical protein